MPPPLDRLQLPSDSDTFPPPAHESVSGTSLTTIGQDLSPRIMLQRHPILENERTAQAGVPQCVQHEISHTRDTDVGVEAVLRVAVHAHSIHTTP